MYVCVWVCAVRRLREILGLNVAAFSKGKVFYTHLIFHFFKSVSKAISFASLHLETSLTSSYCVEIAFKLSATVLCIYEINTFKVKLNEMKKTKMFTQLIS